MRLFQTRIIGGGFDSTQGRRYDVAPITLIQNWNPDAKKQ